MYVSAIRVNPFSGKNGEVSSDKNSKTPVYLNYIKGQLLPAKARVLSGTIAENLNLKVGKSYLVSVQETEIHPEFGQQYSTSVISELEGKDLIDFFKEELKVTVKNTTKVEENVNAGAKVE